MSVQYLVNESGEKTGVFLSIDEYEELLERAEDTEALDMLRKMRDKPIETRVFDDFLEQYNNLHD